jgi:hypothetical protein
VVPQEQVSHGSVSVDAKTAPEPPSHRLRIPVPDAESVPAPADPPVAAKGTADPPDLKQGLAASQETTNPKDDAVQAGGSPSSSGDGDQGNPADPNWPASALDGKAKLPASPAPPVPTPAAEPVPPATETVPPR